MHKETVERSTLELIRKLQSHKSLKDFCALFVPMHTRNPKYNKKDVYCN